MSENKTMTSTQNRIRRVVITILLLLALWFGYWGVNLWAGGVSFDGSVNVLGWTLNAYHYDRNARYNWGIQQWGYAP